MRHSVVLFTSDRGISPARAAQAAEKAGFDSFYVPEHTHIPVRRDALHPRTGTKELPDDRYLRTLDPWVALSTAAAVTTTIRLGTAVALPVQHDPIALAKTVASLDHLSGGRVTLGVGFGWNTDELADHGVATASRRDVLREYLEAMQALWSQEEASYTGEFVGFGASWAWPKPVQQPRMPILLGAGGTDRNFAWIVRSADGWLTAPGRARRGTEGRQAGHRLARGGPGRRPAGRRARRQARPRHAGPLERERRDRGTIRHARPRRRRGCRLPPQARQQTRVVPR